MKRKTWKISIECQITNYDEDGGDIEDKKHIVSLLRDSMDLSNYSYTLGEFKTKALTLKVEEIK